MGMILIIIFICEDGIAMSKFERKRNEAKNKNFQTSQYSVFLSLY